MKSYKDVLLGIKNPHHRGVMSWPRAQLTDGPS